MPKEESGMIQRTGERSRSQKTDEIKNKCYIGIRGVYTTGVCVKGIELSSKLSLPF